MEPCYLVIRINGLRNLTFNVDPRARILKIRVEKPNIKKVFVL